MLNRIYTALFGEPKIFVTEVDDKLRKSVKSMKDTVDVIKIYNDMICYLNDIEIGMEQCTTNIGIYDVQRLHVEVSRFLYEYQKAIPFDKTPYIQCLQPTRKYCFTPFLFENAHSGAFSSAKSNGSMRILNAQRCKKGFRVQTEDDFYKKILYEKWVGEAKLFLIGKKEFTDKILSIYSDLDYMYNYSNTYNRKKMKNWRFRMKEDGTIANKCGEKKTLDEILCGLISYQEGIYNDNGYTRDWGLYRSSFYNIVMYNILTKIILDIDTAIKFVEEENV